MASLVHWHCGRSPRTYRGTRSLSLQERCRACHRYSRIISRPVLSTFDDRTQPMHAAHSVQTRLNVFHRTHAASALWIRAMKPPYEIPVSAVPENTGS